MEHFSQTFRGQFFKLSNLIYSKILGTKFLWFGPLAMLFKPMKEAKAILQVNKSSICFLDTKQLEWHVLL